MTDNFRSTSNSTLDNIERDGLMIGCGGGGCNSNDASARCTITKSYELFSIYFDVNRMEIAKQ